MRRSNLAAERARKGLNKTQLAKLLGVDRHTYIGWEEKGVSISYKNLIKLSNILDCKNLNYLIRQDNSTTN